MPCAKCNDSGRVLKLDTSWLEDPDEFDAEEDVYEDYCECRMGPVAQSADWRDTRRQLRQWKESGELEELRVVLKAKYELTDEEIDTLANED